MLITTIHPSWKKIILIDKRVTKGHPFCEELDNKIHTVLEKWGRLLIIWPKANFSSGMVCTDCGQIPQCDNCALAIWRHKDEQGQMFWLCHLCKTYYPSTGFCPTCQWHNFETYGHGLQHLAEIMKSNYGVECCLVDRSVANSLPKMQKLLPKLQASRCLLSTTLLSQPPADLSIDLVIITHADLGLQSPDLYASRRNYCFLTEICTKYAVPEIRMHTYDTEQPSIQYAIQWRPEDMLTYEHTYRKRFWYPPYTELCVLLYKHEIENRLYTTVNKLYQELLFLKSSYQQEQIEIYSTPPLIYKAFGKFRYHIVLKWPQVHDFMEIAFSKLKMSSRGFKVDWEPQNLI